MRDRARTRRPFPWALWLLAILTAGILYAFFILPRQLPERKMKVEFIQPEVKP